MPLWISAAAPVPAVATTAATEMSRLGVTQFVVGKVLNHADRSVTGIYNRYEYLNEKRQALETWAHYLGKLTGAPLGANAAVLPPNAALGMATVIVTLNGTAATGTVTITSAAPAKVAAFYQGGQD